VPCKYWEGRKLHANLRVLLISAAAIPFQVQAQDQSYAPPGYNLVWADEFAEPGLPDQQNWGYETDANATGWDDGELQYYAAARPETTKVSDGVLSIIARSERLTSAEDYGGQAYTSGRLTTEGKQEWTYGHFEMRAKLPCGEGTLSSFMTLGPEWIPWPDAGGIDIMAQLGAEPNTIYPTVNTKATATKDGAEASIELADACKTFHVYHVTWTPDEIVIGVDGTIHLTYQNKGKGPENWPFDKPQHLVAYLAVGGDAAGNVDKSIFPVSFDIDYIRVYQKSE
jgi:beta-glucanase (GH16 family)